MITNFRSHYNEQFSEEKYQKFLEFVSTSYNHTPAFRISETPVFLPKGLKKQLEQACEEISDVICSPDFKEKTKNAIKDPKLVVPNEDEHAKFIAMDFGICHDQNGEPIPQLIEVQGFPSLYFFQLHLGESFRKFFDIPNQLTSFFGGLTKEAYVDLLRKEIVGGCKPENVILLEIEPEKQATRIDFLVTEKYLGIKVLCLSKVIKEGKDLYYLDENGSKIEIKRIYNRVIFDELTQRTDFKYEFKLNEPINAEWVGHPNWFFKISKYIMPLLRSPYVPECFYLSDVKNNYPADLENYVLKPLYSFAGSGVKLHTTKEELDAIEDKENFILQKKVKYEPVIKSPNEPVKFEIRMLMIWEDGAKRPRIINNLIRLSKGEMIGVKFNKDKDWVGASVGFFEE